ncbi:hypothetical protein P9990_25020 (plasmid) [Prescottella equi]|uniref:hypothetical protein n=1 Tax=Rhodococcus hoagii TaxID=43767 RepID=UPI002577468B|nr:hypothetical protein [Prescottella equi]WJJ14461.1 hypothetical protein P9990_25020 [Prescottella equi]
MDDPIVLELTKLSGQDPGASPHPPGAEGSPYLAASRLSIVEPGEAPDDPDYPLTLDAQDNGTTSTQRHRLRGD